MLSLCAVVRSLYVRSRTEQSGPRQARTARQGDNSAGVDCRSQRPINLLRACVRQSTDDAPPQAYRSDTASHWSRNMESTFNDNGQDKSAEFKARDANAGAFREAGGQE